MLRHGCIVGCIYLIHYKREECEKEWSYNNRLLEERFMVVVPCGCFLL
jgi:hypothetical protein